MRHSLAASILFFLFSLFSISALTNENQFHVIIDPGHGGSDSGAVKNKIKESDLVLQISKKVVSLIQKLQPEMTATLTRSENKFITLEDRIKKTDPAQQIDLFVSLHANSSASSYVQGMEVYFQPDQIKKSDTVLQSITTDLESIGKSKHSLTFAKNLQSSWTLGNSVIRRSSFFVVEKSEYPSVLIELGFLSNPAEAEKLKSAAYQSLIAETIVKSIVDYKNSAL